MATFNEIETRDMAERRPKDGRARAHWALAGLAIVVALPYLLPQLKSYRIWTPQDPLPFAGLFNAEHSALLVAETSSGTGVRAGISKIEKRLMRPMASQPTRSVPAPPKPTPRFGASLAGLKSKIPESDYKAISTLIVDPHGAMKPFYRALAKTLAAKDKSLTRISHWGDSAIAPDIITASARHLFQKRFGDGGHGFILASPPTRWYAHAGLTHRRKNWTNLRITHRASRDGRYGLGGVRSRGDASSFASYAPRRGDAIGSHTSRFQVYYLKGPLQGKFSIRVDRTKREIISAKSKTKEDAVHTVSIKDAYHRFRVAGFSGKTDLYGVALERDGPGVVYDNLGLTGYFGSRLLNIDLEHFKRQLNFRQPDLMLASFGGNYLGHPYWRPKSYRKSFDRVVAFFREARPEAACLFISPVDHGEVHEGKRRTKPRLIEMVAIQKEVALRHKCAYYNLFEAMGGEGTMARWSRTRPRLGVHDMAHVTNGGARILARLLYGALIKGFVEYLPTAAN